MFVGFVGKAGPQIVLITSDSDNQWGLIDLQAVAFNDANVREEIYR